MRTSVLFGTKTFGFFEIYVVSARTRWKGVEPVRTFFGKGRRESIFYDFVRTSFMDGFIYVTLGWNEKNFFSKSKKV